MKRYKAAEISKSQTLKGFTKEHILKNPPDSFHAEWHNLFGHGL